MAHHACMTNQACMARQALMISIGTCEATGVGCLCHTAAMSRNITAMTALTTGSLYGMMPLQ